MRKILLAGAALTLLAGPVMVGTASAATMAPTTKSDRMAAAALPANASAITYLQLAETAVANHQKTRAHVALGRAETVLLTNSYPAGSVNGPISTPVISAIRDARGAVERGNYENAASLIRQAVKDVHGHDTM